MSRFSASTSSAAEVAVERSKIWAVLTDTELLPRLNPLVERIEVDGDHWRWHFIRIAALGVSISPKCTERMMFTEPERIDLEHEPPAGVRERAGAAGSYVLSDTDGGTNLQIDLTVSIELPLPKAAGRAVRRIMKSTMDRTGRAFTANLTEYLTR